MRLAAAVFFGTFRCQCDRFRRAVERHPELDEPRPWSWEVANGCTTEAPTPVASFRGKNLMRCPAKLVPAWCWPYLVIWQQWKRGTLAVAGGTLDQPAKITDAMLIIGSTIGDLERAKAEAPPPGGVAVGGRPRGTFGSPNAPAPSTGPHSRRGRGRI